MVTICVLMMCQPTGFQRAGVRAARSLRRPARIVGRQDAVSLRAAREHAPSRIALVRSFDVCVRSDAFLTDRNGDDYDAGLRRNGDHYAAGMLLMVTMTLWSTQRAARQQVSTA